MQQAQYQNALVFLITTAALLLITTQQLILTDSIYKLIIKASQS